MTITKGINSPYQAEYLNGYQAYWSGRDQRSNPFKKQPQSDQYKMWKMGFLNAKQVEETGQKYGLNIDKIREQYKKE